PLACSPLRFCLIPTCDCSLLTLACLLTTFLFDPYLLIRYWTSACSPPAKSISNIRSSGEHRLYLDSEPQVIPLLRHGDLPVYLSCWFQVSLSTAIATGL
ncbi:unnamed protein product, partial [Staurois parvus]